MGFEILHWTSFLSPDAHALVEKRRRRYVRGYEELKERGYQVVGEVVPPSGRLLRRGRRALVTMIQEIVAQEEIERLKGLFDEKNVDFEWAEGAVVPCRRDVTTIAESKHIRAHTKGVTIFIRDAAPKMMAAYAPLERALEAAFV